MNVISGTILSGAILILSMLASSAGAGSGDGVFTDLHGDAMIRRTDSGNNAPLPVGYVPLDLLELRLEGWEPFSPQSDPYNGTATNGDAALVRIQVEFDGVVCPPGPLALDGSGYNPYQFGDRPFFGYIEIDIDDQKNTGGEFMPLAQNRYLANVARFGLSPYGSFSERIARSADDIDSNFFTLPDIERTGGEFTLAMCGCFTPSIVSQNGDMDFVFDSGETWIVSGRFFERFNAFQSESSLFGGSDFGLFDPIVNLQFKHDIESDTTIVTLVFPITNEGAAQLLGGSTQDIDLSLVNQTSIEEALDDLIGGAPFATGALHELVDNWENRDIEDYRRPRDWYAHAIVGTAPITKDPAALFIWTDTGFGEVLGDLNDDDLSDSFDTQLIIDYVDDEDGGLNDADGILDGQVSIIDFGSNFDLRDINGDGVISENDIIVSTCAADLTGDRVLNFFDVSAFLSAYNTSDPTADINADGALNFFDVSAFLELYGAGCL
jgi:hypothetical protein